jgi:hypothetical protein
MPIVPAACAMFAVGALSAGLFAVPAAADAKIAVLCSESALVSAVTAANAAGGGVLALTPFCTYPLTSAHGSADDGPAGLPPITRPITLVGLGTTIARAASAPEFRILEVDGAANVPHTAGQLVLEGITVTGGSAVAPYPGGGIANRGGGVFLTASSVTDNTAVAGGGIYTDNGAVSLVASSVTGNTATVFGGGGAYDNSGPVNLLASNVSGNHPDNCAPAGNVPGCAG